MRMSEPDLGLVQADEPQGTDQQTENLYDEEARALENERLRAEVDNLIQDREQRKTYGCLAQRDRLGHPAARIRFRPVRAVSRRAHYAHRVDYSLRSRAVRHRRQLSVPQEMNTRITSIRSSQFLSSCKLPPGGLSRHSKRDTGALWTATCRIIAGLNGGGKGERRDAYIRSE